jgi:pimeloyl-ACP methyl ester carboxylesterase
MIEFCVAASALAAEPNFSAADVLNGAVAAPSDCGGPGKVWVEVDGRGDCLRFYGTIPDGSSSRPIIFLEGDGVQQNGKSDVGQTLWDVPPYYTQLSPSIMQAEAEQYAAATRRPFINLARPGIYGSSGNHMERRRKREVDLVNAALDRLKERFGWDLISLAGLSGGGHLVGALLARRADVDCAVIASGNVAVRRRLQERGLAADVTGFTDFIDPVDDVGEVARHPPRSVIMLTDPMDVVVTASSQRVYLAALREAGVKVEQRHVAARDASHHLLRIPAILAALACQ